MLSKYSMANVLIFAGAVFGALFIDLGYISPAAYERQFYQRQVAV